MKSVFKAIEGWLERTFCQQPEASPSGGGKKDGMSDAERNAEGDGRIPKFSEL
jgi:hypothetical protein